MAQTPDGQLRMFTADENSISVMQLGGYRLQWHLWCLQRLWHLRPTFIIFLLRMFLVGASGFWTTLPSWWMRECMKGLAGPGWPQRSDAKYSTPLSFPELQSVNRAYMNGLLHNQRFDDHWQQL
eukprot:4973317-Amphidinium_carterae.1